MSEPAEKPLAKITCRCGHDAKHHMVNEEAEYSLVGWLAVMFGISYRPRLLKYRCRSCNVVFFSTNDPDALDRHY